MWKLFRFSSRTPPEWSGAEAQRGWTGILSKNRTTHTVIFFELTAKSWGFHQPSCSELLPLHLEKSREYYSVLNTSIIITYILTPHWGVLSLIIRFANSQLYSSLRNPQPGGGGTFNRCLFFFCPHLCSHIRGGLQQYQLNYSPLWLGIIENHWELLRIILLFDREGRLKVISSLERPGGGHYRSQ